MKNSVKINLRIAVKKLFVRLHKDLFDEIYHECKALNNEQYLFFNEDNSRHRLLIKLCREKIGFASASTNQDIFYSIMRVYVENILGPSTSKPDQSISLKTDYL
jgi:L-rhamnose mutarotase